MLARARGSVPRPVPRGEVFRVVNARTDDGGPAEPVLSEGWTTALAEVEAALAEDLVVGVVGEPGTGKTALLAAAHRRVRPQYRVLTARPPEPRDADSWLSLWTPELGKDNTSVIVGRVDSLPSWAATELGRMFVEVGSHAPQGALRRPFAVTAEDFPGIPAPLSALVDTLVELPALRHRPDDVLALAHFFGHQVRGRGIRFTPAASRALTTYHWPGNVRQLKEVVREAAARADVIDARHLAADVFSGAARRLSRIETLERDEIVRCLTEPGATLVQAAVKLGISRATLYRKISQYELTVPGRSRP
jgi:hypothetical protein